MSKALLIIDMQSFVEQRIESGMGYYPLDALSNMTRLLAEFRQAGLQVIHVHHSDQPPSSESFILSGGYVPLADFAPRDNEKVFIKNTSSAFVSTRLKSYLESMDLKDIIVMGAVCGFCVNSTVRHGRDLGLNMHLAQDATISFSLKDGANEAKNIHQVTCSLLSQDFANVQSVDRLLADLLITKPLIY